MAIRPADINLTSSLDSSGAMRDLQDFARKIKPISLKIDSQPLGTISRQASEFQKSLAAAQSRVLAFSATAGQIYTLSRAFSALIKSTIDVEKSLKDINVILGLSNRELSRFSDDLFRIANETGQSFKVAAEAATELSRQGLSAAETLKRVRDALTLTRLSGLDVVSSVTAITTALNGFNDAALDSTAIINKLANVDAQFAVSSKDLADSLSRVGSTAKDVGVSFDELLGLVTAAKQITGRDGAVIGNALKTIFQRIERPEVIDNLKQLGVLTEDLSGKSLGAKEVLTNLAKAYKDLSGAQQNQVVQLASGVFQANQFRAILSDLAKQNSITARATDASASATDQAARRQSELNKTLAAGINETINNLTSVAAKAGQITLEPVIKRITSGISTLTDSLSGSSGEKGGEEVGTGIGAGLLKGIGNYLSGPGLALAATVLTKFFFSFASFTTKSLSQIIESSTKRYALEQATDRLISRQPELMGQIVKLGGDQVRIRQLINAELIKELALLNQISSAKENVTSGISRSAFGFQLSSSKPFAVSQKDEIIANPRFNPKRAAVGLVPALQETAGAIKGGYQPGNIKQINIPKLGPVVYNDAEKIKYFPGLSQPAIIPPAYSKAGQNYKQEFVATHGFNPYAAEGLIPNYAFEQTGKFRQPNQNRLNIAKEQLQKSGLILNDFNIPISYDGPDRNFGGRYTPFTNPFGANPRISINSGAPVSTYRHEYGHFIDNLMGALQGGKYFSLENAGKLEELNNRKYSNKYPDNSKEDFADIFSFLTGSGGQVGPTAIKKYKFTEDNIRGFIEQYNSGKFGSFKDILKKYQSQFKVVSPAYNNKIFTAVPSGIPFDLAGSLATKLPATNSGGLVPNYSKEDFLKFFQENSQPSPLPISKGYEMIKAFGGNDKFARFAFRDKSELYNNPKLLELETLQAFPPGQGIGSEFMKMLTQAADAHDIDLILNAYPLFGKGGKNAQKRLGKFYSKFGFEKGSKNPYASEMTRKSLFEHNGLIPNFANFHINEFDDGDDDRRISVFEVFDGNKIVRTYNKRQEAQGFIDSQREKGQARSSLMQTFFKNNPNQKPAFAKVISGYKKYYETNKIPDTFGLFSKFIAGNNLKLSDGLVPNYALSAGSTYEEKEQFLKQVRKDIRPQLLKSRRLEQILSGSGKHVNEYHGYDLPKYGDSDNYTLGTIEPDLSNINDVFNPSRKAGDRKAIKNTFDISKGKYEGMVPNYAFTLPSVGLGDQIDSGTFKSVFNIKSLTGSKRDPSKVVGVAPKIKEGYEDISKLQALNNLNIPFVPEYYGLGQIEGQLPKGLNSKLLGLVEKVGIIDDEKYLNIFKNAGILGDDPEDYYKVKQKFAGSIADQVKKFGLSSLETYEKGKIGAKFPILGDYRARNLGYRNENVLEEISKSMRTSAAIGSRQPFNKMLFDLMQSGQFVIPDVGGIAIPSKKLPISFANGNVPNFSLQGPLPSLDAVKERYKKSFLQSKKGFISYTVDNARKEANINNIRSSLGVEQGGIGKELYPLLMEKLKSEGVGAVRGELMNQGRKPRSNSPVDKLKALFPQLVRGRYAANNEITFPDSDYSIPVAGGDKFDEDLKRKASFILKSAATSSSFDLTSYLSKGLVPNYALSLGLMKRALKTFKDGQGNGLVNNITRDSSRGAKASVYVNDPGYGSINIPKGENSETILHEIGHVMSLNHHGQGVIEREQLANTTAIDMARRFGNGSGTDVQKYKEFATEQIKNYKLGELRRSLTFLSKDNSGTFRENSQHLINLSNSGAGVKELNSAYSGVVRDLIKDYGIDKFRNYIKDKKTDRSFYERNLGAPAYLSKGLVPNFSALSSAVLREKSAGIPASQIRVDSHPLIKSPQNPLGLGVYNTKDEPGGLIQGIQRVAAMGLDPKKSGIPNYAAPETFGGTFGISQEGQLPRLTVKELNQKIFAYQSLIEAGIGNQKTLNKSVVNLANDYNLTGDAMTKVAKVLQSSFDARKAPQKLLGFTPPSSGGYTKAEQFNLPLEFRPSNKELEKRLYDRFPRVGANLGKYGPSDDRDFTGDTVLKLRTAQDKRRAADADLSRIKSVNSGNLAFSDDPSGQRVLLRQNYKFEGIRGEARGIVNSQINKYLELLASGAKESSEGMKKFRDSIFANVETFSYTKKAATTISTQVQDILRTGAPQASVLGQEKVESDKLKVRQARAINNGINVDISKGYESVKTTISESIKALKQGQVNPAERRDITKQLIEKARESRRFDTTKEFDTRFGNVGLTGLLTGKYAQASKFARDNGLETSQRNLRQTLQGRALNASFVLPLAGGVVEQGINNAFGETTGGRGAARTVGGLTNIASFAATGFGIGGGAGAGVGLGLGLLSELPSIIKSFSDTLPDLQRNMERLSEESQRLNTSFNTFLTTTQKLSDIDSGDAKATVGQRNAIERQRNLSLSGIPQAARARVIEAAKNGDFATIADITANYSRLSEQKSLFGQDLLGAGTELQKNKRGITLKDRLNTSYNSFGGGVGDGFLADTGASLLAPISAAASYFKSSDYTGEAINSLSSLRERENKAALNTRTRPITESILQFNNKKGESFANLLTDSDISNIQNARKSGNNEFITALSNTLSSKGIDSKDFEQNLRSSPAKVQESLSDNAATVFTRKFIEDQRENNKKIEIAAKEFSGVLNSLNLAISDAARAGATATAKFEQDVLKRISELGTNTEIGRISRRTGNEINLNRFGGNDYLKIRQEQSQAVSEAIDEASVGREKIQGATSVNIRKLLNTQKSNFEESVLKDIARDPLVGKNQKDIDAARIKRLSQAGTLFEDTSVSPSELIEKARARIENIDKTSSASQVFANVENVLRETKLNNLTDVSKNPEFANKYKDVIKTVNDITDTTIKSQLQSKNLDELSAQNVSQDAAKTLRDNLLDIITNANNILIEQSSNLEQINNSLEQVKRLEPAKARAAKRLLDQQIRKSIENTNFAGQLERRNIGVESSVGISLQNSLSRNQIRRIGSTPRESIGLDAQDEVSRIRSATKIRDFGNFSDFSKEIKDNRILENISQRGLDGLVDTYPKIIELVNKLNESRKTSVKIEEEAIRKSNTGAGNALSEYDREVSKYVNTSRFNTRLDTRDIRRDRDSQIDLQEKLFANELGKRKSSAFEGVGIDSNSREIEIRQRQSDRDNQADTDRLKRLNNNEDPKKVAADYNSEKQKSLDIANKELAISKQLTEQEAKRVTMSLRFSEARLSDVRNRNRGLAESDTEEDRQSLFSKENLRQSLFGGLEQTRTDFNDELIKIVETFTTDLKDSFKSGFRDILSGATTFKEGLRNIGLDIASKVSGKVSDLAIDTVAGAGFNLLKGVAGAKNGRYIPKYASGGYVDMGSGVRDDVPAFLSGGEFVLNAKAVKKIGKNNLDNLNFGGLKRYASGGSASINLTNTYDIDNDRFNVDPSLSAYGQMDENNPQNKIKFDREEYAIDYKSYLADRQKFLKDFEKKKMAALYSSYFSAATTLAGGALGSFGSGSSGNFDNSISKDFTGYGSTSKSVSSRGFSTARDNDAFTKAVRSKYAKGGYFGGDHPGDRLGAMVMGGEYIVSPKTVSQYGVNFFNKLNKGNFAYGGEVGRSDIQDNLSEMIKKLSDVTESINKLTSVGSNPTTNKDSGAASKASAPVYNITVNTTLNSNGSTSSNTTESKTDNTSDDKKKGEDLRRLNEVIKSKVIEGITQESQNGGIIYENFSPRR